MKKYLYSEKDLEIIKYLKSKKPLKIWWNVTHYIFQYPDFYITIKIVRSPEPPVSFNNQGYIMTAGLKKNDEQFKPSDIAICICENEKISDVYIVRTMLYYHDYRKTKNTDSTMSGYFGDFIVHPDSVVDKDVNPETLNLVDVGLLFKIKEKYINAYIRDNDDDFWDYDEIYLHGNFNLSDKSQPYQFIKIE